MTQPLPNGVSLEVLQQLQELLGDGFSGLLEVFVSDSGQRLEHLKSALQRGDYAGVIQQAHTLRGSCLDLGFCGIEKACAALELAAKQPEPAQLQCLYISLEQQLVLLQQWLQPFAQGACIRF